MGGNVSKGSDNDDLVDNLLNDRFLKTPRIQQVFRAVDRGLYFTKDNRKHAYDDTAWRSGNIHLSAPGVYSEVMENLEIGPGMSFLNLGSGTGYLNTMAGLLLGPYGLNYGVEVHKDVVQYAYKRLEKFKWTAEAIDEYDFCEPRFFQGNCLQLSSENRLYDRLYCGAACPPSYENYMKNLIKIGGILVMPLDEDLVKVKRTSETTWEKTSITPVNFANMILPSPCETSPPQLLLANPGPLSLQVMCRTAIRQTLRQIIREENPKLQTHRIRRPDTRRPDLDGLLGTHPAVRMYLLNKHNLPFVSANIYGSDDEDDEEEHDLPFISAVNLDDRMDDDSSSSDSDDDQEKNDEDDVCMKEENSEGGEDFGRMNGSGESPRQRVQLRMKRKKAHQKSSSSDSGTDVEEMKECGQSSSLEESLSNKKTVKKSGEKPAEEGKGLKSSALSESPDSPKKNGTGETSAEGASCSNSVSVRTSEENVDEEDEDSCDFAPQKYRKKYTNVSDTISDRQKTFVTNCRMSKKKEKEKESPDTGSEKGQSDAEENKEERPEPAADEPSYCVLMREKIRALPLPPTIQSYLNFHRTF